jgi:hypothetical protein
MLGLSTMTKNQSPRLKEWILYFSNQGIEKFIIFLDNCSDDSKDELNRIKLNYHIDIDIYLTEEFSDKSIQKIDWVSRSHYMYDFTINTYKYLDWIAFIELDEFVFPMKKNNKLSSFLNNLESDCLYINSWDYQGPFNENEKILGQCYMGWTDLHRSKNGYLYRGKSIIRPSKFIKCMDAHHFKQSNNLVSNEFKINRNVTQVYHGKEVYIDDNIFRIGHFRNHTPITTLYNYINNENLIKRNVAIIGSGWYGCYIAEYLLDNFKHLNITIIDKNDDIFKESSYKNQNRLHLGFHYPKCEITRNKCKNNFNKFLSKYKELLLPINKNFYVIANDSNIDYDSYLKLYDDYDYKLVTENNFIENIQGEILNTNEMFIDFRKAQKYFKNKFQDRISFKFNYMVNLIETTGETLKINNELEFDKVFNATYNQFYNKNILADNIIYEKCLTLLYKKKEEIPFDCLTIMDGNYSSIYKYSDNIYTLTNVLHTPIKISNNFNDIENDTLYDLNEKISLFEENIIKFYPDFKNKFEYVSKFESFKCKKVSNIDTRDITIDIINNIFNVWCGKISLIFELDKYIDKYIY